MKSSDQTREYKMSINARLALLRLAFEIRDQGGLDGFELSFLRSYRYAQSGLAAANEIGLQVLAQGA